MQKEISAPPSLNLRRASKIISYLPQILALLFIVGFAVYAWTEPDQPPPLGNVPAPINVSTTTQTKTGSFVVGGAAFEVYNNTFLSTLGGSVGIGTATPDDKLDVTGIIHSSSGGFKFPDDTVQTTAAAGGVPDCGWYRNNCLASWINRGNPIDGYKTKSSTEVLGEVCLTEDGLGNPYWNALPSKGSGSTDQTIQSCQVYPDGWVPLCQVWWPSTNQAQEKCNSTTGCGAATCDYPSYAVISEQTCTTVSWCPSGIWPSQCYNCVAPPVTYSWCCPN